MVNYFQVFNASFILFIDLAFDLSGTQVIQWRFALCQKEAGQGPGVNHDHSQVAGAFQCMAEKSPHELHKLDQPNG